NPALRPIPVPASVGTRRDQKNEQQLLERLDPAILDVIHNPKKDSKNCLYRNVNMTNALIDPTVLST
ncbi:MAG: hypothetical protein PVH43_09780, partial [Desulfobacterales bacterium]